MSSSNGIFQRGSFHYLRVVLPNGHPLHKLYKSGKVVISLKACSYREAVTTGAIKRAEILGWSESKTMPFTSRNPSPKSQTPTEYYLRDIYGLTLNQRSHRYGITEIIQLASLKGRYKKIPAKQMVATALYKCGFNQTRCWKKKDSRNRRYWKYEGS